jgi:hypothetical protein
MPNILVLVDRETNERHEGRGLIEVDEKLCAALGVGCDDTTFLRGWVDWWCLYMNEDWEGVRKAEKETGFDPAHYAKRAEIIDWLAGHYTLNGYAVIGRR